MARVNVGVLLVGGLAGLNVVLAIHHPDLSFLWCVVAGILPAAAASFARAERDQGG